MVNHHHLNFHQFGEHVSEILSNRTTKQANLRRFQGVFQGIKSNYHGKSSPSKHQHLKGRRFLASLFLPSVSSPGKSKKISLVSDDDLWKSTILPPFFIAWFTSFTIIIIQKEAHHSHRIHGMIGIFTYMMNGWFLWLNHVGKYTIHIPWIHHGIV